MCRRPVMFGGGMQMTKVLASFFDASTTFPSWSTALAKAFAFSHRS